MEVVDEGEVEDAVGGAGAGREAVEVRQLSAVNLGAEALEGLGGGIVACEPEDLMPGGEQLGDRGTTNEACGTCDKDTHDDLLGEVGGGIVPVRAGKFENGYG